MSVLDELAAHISSTTGLTGVHGLDIHGSFTHIEKGSGNLVRAEDVNAEARGWLISLLAETITNSGDPFGFVRASQHHRFFEPRVPSQVQVVRASDAVRAAMVALGFSVLNLISSTVSARFPEVRGLGGFSVNGDVVGFTHIITSFGPVPSRDADQSRMQDLVSTIYEVLDYPDAGVNPWQAVQFTLDAGQAPSFFHHK